MYGAKCGAYAAQIHYAIPFANTLSVLAILQSLLGDPKPASPENDAAAKAFVHDRPGYDATVREQVRSTFYATRVKVKREQEEEGSITVMI